MQSMIYCQRLVQTSISCSLVHEQEEQAQEQAVIAARRAKRAKKAQRALEKAAGIDTRQEDDLEPRSSIQVCKSDSESLSTDVSTAGIHTDNYPEACLGKKVAAHSIEVIWNQYQAR
jgi:hypothetical protein